MVDTRVELDSGGFEGVVDWEVDEEPEDAILERRLYLFRRCKYQVNKYQKREGRIEDVRQSPSFAKMQRRT